MLLRPGIVVVQFLNADADDPATDSAFRSNARFSSVATIKAFCNVLLLFLERVGLYKLRQQAEATGGRLDEENSANGFKIQG
jgi:hypothetical protein